MEVIPITVLMSVYNGEAYLEEAIRSILQQTFRHFELLIIDDGSSDNSIGIVEGIKDDRIRLVVNEINLGLTKSLNKGIDLAHGQYIARMDADDISFPNRLQLQFDFLETNQDFGLVGGWRQILRNGKLSSKNEALFVGHEAICVQQLFRNGFVHSAIMMRTSLARSLRYNETIFAAQDYDMWVRLSQHAKVANLPLLLVQYRVHSNSISETKLHRQIETVRGIQNQQLKDWGLAPTREELDIHLLIGLTMTGHMIKDQEAGAASNWLMRLLHHNQATGKYEENVMDQVCIQLWRSLFNRKSCRVHLIFLWENWSHPLNHGMRTKWVIFANCIKHYPVFRSLYAFLKK